MEQAVRAEVKVFGKVQRVFFRARARERAQDLGVAGWIRNSEDGTVEAVVEGPQAQVQTWIEWAQQGPPAANVEHLEVDWEEPEGAFSDFVIQR